MYNDAAKNGFSNDDLNQCSGGSPTSVMLKVRDNFKQPKYYAQNCVYPRAQKYLKIMLDKLYKQ